MATHVVKHTHIVSLALSLFIFLLLRLISESFISVMLTYIGVHVVFRGVTAVAYSKHGRSVYTAGADGMVCRIDASDGAVVGKFKSSSKAISALAVSSGVSTVK